jgi:hypothetical protein
MTEQKIRAIMIIEIAGRPPEHIKQALEKHTEQLKNLKDVRLISNKISKPKRLESEQEMYTCFAEIEIETESFLRLTEIMFDFMPSSIEIIEPNEVKMNMQQATMFLNNLTGRLHRYDEIAKIANIQNQQLLTKLRQLEQGNISEKREDKTKPGKIKKKPVKRRQKKKSKKK